MNFKKINHIKAYIFSAFLFIAQHTYAQMSGTLDTSFRNLSINSYSENILPYSIGFSSGTEIRSVVLQANGKILAGGYFKSYNGASINHIIRLNEDFTMDFTFQSSLGPNSYVNTIALQSDNKILIGGYFTSYDSIRKNRIARLNSNGSLDATFNIGIGANGSVRSIVLQPDGKILIAGGFTTINGIPASRVARLNSDGSLDATFNIGIGASDSVNSIILQPDGKILIVGAFTTFNGISKNKIARLNSDGSLDATFNPGTGASHSIYAIAVQTDGKILIGGDFTTFSGNGYNRIARLNSNGSIDASFNPGLGTNGSVYSLVIQSDGKIIVGGMFTTYNSTTSKFITRINANGSLDTEFNTGTGINGYVNSVIQQTNGKTLIGGYFTSYNGNEINGIVRLNSDASLDENIFKPGAGLNGTVYSTIVQPDNKILVCGNFTSFNGIKRNNIVRLKTVASLDPTFNPGIGANNTIRTIVLQPDGRIIIGGDFTSFNGVARNRIARLNSDGSLDISFDPGTGTNTGSVRSIALQPNGKILIAGYFTSYNGTPTNMIARLNTDGSLDATFNSGTGPNNLVNSIVLQPDGKILIGGSFGAYNGTSRTRIARLNSDGSLDATTFSSPISDINNIALQNNGKILIASNSSSGILNGIYRLNSDGSLDATFNTSGIGIESSKTVNIISLQPDNRILIGGTFTSYNGTSRNRIARLNIDGSLDSTFNIGTGFNNNVLALLLITDNKILAGGSFTSYNSIARNYMACLNPDGSLSSPSTDGANGPIYKIIQQQNGKILIGGNFTSYNGITINRIARLNINGDLDNTFNPGTGANNAIRTIILQPDGKILIGGDFTSFNGIARNHIARINIDGSIDPSFNPGTGANNNRVYSIALQQNGKILISGDFTSYNGTTINRIARLNTDGSIDDFFNPGIGAAYPNSTPQIKTVAVQTDGKILIGGFFKTYNGLATNSMVRLNTDGSLDDNFSFISQEFNKDVNSIVLQTDGKILFGTNYDGSENKKFIGRLNTDGSLDVTFKSSSGIYTNVYSIVLQPDNKILIGGYFNSSSNISSPRNNIARLYMDGSLDHSFYSGGCDLGAGILSMALQSDNKILVAGDFNKYEEYNHKYIVRLNNILTNSNINLAPATVCAGNQFNLSYNSNQSAFTAGNNFTVELSDSLGNFSNNVKLIGSMISTSNNGNIICTIPANISGGTLYKVRVNSSIPFSSSISGPLQIVNLNNSPLNLGITGNSCLNSFVSYGALFTVENIPGASYQWSNGQAGNPVRITTSGIYTLTLSHQVCPLPKTHTYNLNISPISNCGGVLIIEADSVINYFDTLTVKIKVKGADNLFSIFAKLNFESSRLSLISSDVGNVLGSSIINSPAVVTGNTIDFGMTKTSGQTGTNGDGLVYTFKFKVKAFPNILFNLQIPTETYTTFKLSNPVVNDAVGVQRNMNLNPLPDSTRLRYYVPVWPGDLNNDKICNVADLLPIGYFYNSIGITRPNASLQWLAQPAKLWSYDNSSQAGPSPAYQVFADGNGNGIIDLADQTSIGFNLNKIHARLKSDFEEPGSIINNVGVPLWVDITDTLVPRVQLPKNITARINLGTVDNPYSNFYGVAFDLFFNPSFVDVNNITWNYNNTIFGTYNTDYIKVEDNNAVSGRISIGLTRYNTTELSGYGKVMEVTFPIKQTGPGSYFKVYALPKAANDKSGVPIAVSEGRDSVRVDQIVSSIKHSTNTNIAKIYPNPTNNELTVSVHSKYQTDVEIRILDIKGVDMYIKKISPVISEWMHTINVSGFPKGVYLIQLIDKEESVTDKFLIK